MPSAADAKTGFRFSYFILGVSIVGAVGSYAYGLWVTSQQEKASLPRPAIDQIVKALRTYHHQVGRFPDTFVDLQTRVWRHKRLPPFGEDGHSLSMTNYYYVYYAIDDKACSLWAVPINKRREEGSTFFLALTADAARKWKGAPLGLEEIKRLPPLPDPAQLALLGLTEQSIAGRQPSRAGPKVFRLPPLSL